MLLLDSLLFGLCWFLIPFPRPCIEP
uniref:Uncharacterized protein n=1 Tax=Rhizophora mucronata TaxID=61149 RepID=A0A2P2NDC3_RHIMU